MTNGRIFAGHPVDIASGELFTARHDIEIPGAISLVWRAYYSTGLLGRSGCLMGPGWTHPFASTLTRDLDGFSLRSAEGARIELTDYEGVVDAGEVLRDLAAHSELRRVGGHYELLHWHAGEESVIKYLFRIDEGPAPMRLEAMEDLWGNRLQVEYDDRGRFARVRQTLEGRQLAAEYNHRGLMSRLVLTSPTSTHPEVVARYEYDAKGRPVEVSGVGGRTVHYAYDEHDRLISEANHTGGTYRMRYDTDGRCVETGGDGGYRLTRLAYFPLQRTTVVTDSLGYATTYGYNSAGQVEKIIQPNGATSSTAYDELGRVVAEIDPLGRQTAYAFDGRGDRVEEVAPSGAVTRIEYNQWHLPTRVTDPDGAVSTFDYDDLGRLVSMTDALGETTQYTRSARNVLQSIRTPSGRVLTIETDDRWTTQVLSDRNGEITRHLDARLVVTEQIDARGNRTRFEHNGRGGITRVISPDGGVKEYIRDANGRIIRIRDANGNLRELRYSPYGEVVASTDPLGHVTELRWDTEGRLVEVIDPKKQVCRFEYDSVGQVIRKTFFDGRVERYEYDLAGQLVRLHRPCGAVVELGYDAAGNRVSEANQDGTVITRTYDAFGQLTGASSGASEVGFEYDARGNLIAEVQDGARIDYAYDGDRNLTGRTFSRSRLAPLGVHYEEEGARWAINSGERVLQVWEFGPDGLLESRRMAGAVETLDYDASHRPVEQRVVRDRGPVLVARSFGYDLEDNLTSVRDSLRGESHYRYDPAERLIGGEHEAWGFVAYRYDECGNLTSKEGRSAYVYGAGNKCVQDDRWRYEYDADARVVAMERHGQTTRLVWDDRSQLAKVIHPDGGETSFGYDALGRRIWKEHRGERARYYWSRNDVIAEERGEELREYLTWDHQLQLVSINGKIFNCVSSRIPVPCELVDERGELAWHGTYDDWGELVSSSSPGLEPPLRFPGQYADAETDLHYNRSRYYSPSNGNFLTPDPLGIVAGFNEFLYAPNPINWVDPLGLDCNRTGCEASKQRTRERIARMQEAMTPQEHGGNIAREAGVQGHPTTFGVAEVLTRDGGIEVRVAQAGSNGYVRPDIRRAAGTETNPRIPETPNINHVNDAERHLLRSLQPGETLLSVGATRPMCSNCQSAYNQAGLLNAVATPLK